MACPLRLAPLSVAHASPTRSTVSNGGHFSLVGVGPGWPQVNKIVRLDCFPARCTEGGAAKLGRFLAHLADRKKAARLKGDGCAAHNSLVSNDGCAARKGRLRRTVRTHTHTAAFEKQARRRGGAGEATGAAHSLNTSCALTF